MTLPGITGLAYSEQLVAQFPAIRLVFMTGWLDRPEWAPAEMRGVLLAALGVDGDVERN